MLPVPWTHSLGLLPATAPKVSHSGSSKTTSQALESYSPQPVLLPTCDTGVQTETTHHVDVAYKAAGVQDALFRGLQCHGRWITRRGDRALVGPFCGHLVRLASCRAHRSATQAILCRSCGVMFKTRASMSRDIVTLQGDLIAVVCY